MKDIQYFDILKRSLRMTWENKFLWVLGLLILLGSLFSEINFNFSKISAKSKEAQFAASFIQDHPHIFLGIILAAILVLVAFFILKFVATAGLIKSANNIAVYRQSTVAGILSESKKYVWPLLGLEIVVSVTLVAILILLIVPVAYLFALKAPVLPIIAVCIALLIFIPLAILAYYLRKFAYFYIILGNMKIRPALESAYSLFSKNMKNSLVMGVVSIVANAGVMATALTSVMVLVVFFIPLGALLYFMFAQTGAIIVATIGVIMGTAVLLALFSWYAAFAQTLWVLFFQQISLEGDPKEKSLAENIEAEIKISNPEAV